jgi:hypothetical protein
MNKKNLGNFFAYSPWDALPALCGVLNAAFVVLFYLAFAYWRAPWWVLICMGFTYSVSIGWNINSVCHNFVHNPFFSSPLLNRLFSLMQSLALGFSQVCYDAVHARHHRGNSDRPGDDGDTIDWVSIYRHGHDHEAESAWTYTFFSYLRDDPFAIIKELKLKDAAEARWTLPLLPQRLLPPLRRRHRTADRLGRKQLPQALQLGLVQQWLPCRASFPPQDALDEDEGISAPDRRGPGSRRSPRHQAAPCARLSRPEPAGKEPLGHGRTRDQDRQVARSAERSIKYPVASSRESNPNGFWHFVASSRACRGIRRTTGQPTGGKIGFGSFLCSLDLVDKESVSDPSTSSG